jgi:predicted ChrR family anti-sigma factor
MSDMDVSHGSDAFNELLTLYALGLLERSESLELEEHVGDCKACAAEVNQLRETASDIPYGLPDLNPHPRVRERVLAELKPNRKAALEQPLPGVFVKRQSQQRWRKTPYEGVEVKILYVDADTNNVTSLLRIQPGASYPAHHHAAVEQCLVLEGTVRIGQVFLNTGDFEFANAGTNHATVESDTGCVLMLISNQRDEVFM